MSLNLWPTEELEGILLGLAVTNLATAACVEERDRMETRLFVEGYQTALLAVAYSIDAQQSGYCGENTSYLSDRIRVFLQAARSNDASVQAQPSGTPTTSQ